MTSQAPGTFLFPCLITLSILCSCTICTKPEGWTPPEIIKPRTAKTLYLGRYDINARLNCKAKGIPEPNIAWYKDGVQIKNNDERWKYDPIGSLEGTLEIPKVSSSYMGYYQCKATNPFGTAVSYLMNVKELQVLGSNVSLYKLEEGDPFSLPCESIPYVTPPDRIKQWLYDENKDIFEMLPTERIGVDEYGTLHFANTLKNDSRVYYCAVRLKRAIPNSNVYLGDKIKIFVAERSASKGESTLNRNPKLAFSEKIVTAFQGQGTILQCFFSARPTANITWKYLTNLERLKSSRFKVIDYGRKLSINPVQQGDEGDYVCVGTNNLGSTQVFIRLIVTGPPSPVPGKVPVSKTISAGSNTSLVCKASTLSHDLPAKPKWYRNGEPLVPNEHKSQRYSFSADYTELYIKDLNFEDSANYECNISNRVGYVFFNAYLRVIKPIVFAWKPPMFLSVKYGDVLDLTVNVTGDKCCPVNTIEWFYQGSPIPDIEAFPPFQRDKVTGSLLFNTTLVMEKNFTSILGNYTYRVSDGYQTITNSFVISQGKLAKGKTNEGSHSYMISFSTAGLVITGVIAFLLVASLFVLVSSKGRHDVTEKEEAGNEMVYDDEIQSDMGVRTMEPGNGLDD